MAKEKLTGTVSRDSGATLSACHQKPNAETQAIQSDGMDKKISERKLLSQDSASLLSHINFEP